ncbi:Pentatricopeptide repeat-containing protein, mitochondrial [Vitis vinifera]|uniref:Pentatricopeptide repeat-containing protein, mitochondrial n=1 Tax=Vitis vinifera TaxID=29760 RepID=A0A438G801_VITVI|nr:Pentatricopeptide repeat-containing protein, mitochondrial [Vitis vinifera]
MNKFTLATALTACANLASLEEGKKAHGLRIKLGNDVELEARSVVSWTTMIMGFAQNGQARKALEIFEQMRAEGKAPNYITFICVLYACSQGGLINEGWEYFLSMDRDHGISPGEDHYACMVDMLGRAGHIKEARELIRRMPFQAGVLVWQTLLGACRVHGDVETGLLAAKQALSLDKDDSSTYVVLSNMFADGRNWKGVGSLRELMETRDVKKMPGSSWIQLNKR